MVHVKLVFVRPRRDLLDRFPLVAEIGERFQPEDAPSESIMNILRSGYFACKVFFAMSEELYAPEIPEESATYNMSRPSLSHGSKNVSYSSALICEVLVTTPRVIAA